MSFSFSKKKLTFEQMKENGDSLELVCNKFNRLMLKNSEYVMPKAQHNTVEDFSNGQIGMIMVSCASYKRVTTLVGDKFEVGDNNVPECGDDGYSDGRQRLGFVQYYT